MKRKFILNIVGLFAILVFIVVSLSFTSVERTHIVFTQLKVVFNQPYQFVTENEIEKIVYENFKGLNGALIDTVNTESIERIIEQHPWIKNAEVFKGYSNPDSLFMNGGMKIFIEQEKPILRVVNGAEGYFVNNQGKHLPFSSSDTKKVPVLTGHINDRFLKEELIPFINIAMIDPFWNALFQQIHVTENEELIIVPRVGDHRIEFGKVENIDKKFRNLKAVYKEGFKEEGWNKYKTLTLKYENQVICTLK